ncbi:MAG TPA: hypothetical protein VGM41_05310 [Chitinophagaceae bacterium]|jgi:hypothetical protein
MKWFSFVLVACVALSSCQKELRYDVDPGTTGGTSGSGGSGSSGGSSYYIKGKRNDTTFSYATNAAATITTTSGVNSLAMIAMAPSPSIELLNLDISFFTTGVTTGTYSEADNLSLNVIVLGLYNGNSAGNTYASGGSLLTGAPPLTITILTKTSTEITGTFSGTLYAPDATGLPSVPAAFTGGSFDLPIK